MNADRSPHFFEKITYWFLLAVPLWWLLGINFFIFHLFSFLAFLLYFFGRRHATKTPPSFFFLLVFIAEYVMSFLLHMDDFGFSRMLASLYNMTYWVMGLCVIFLASNLYSLSGYSRTFMGVAIGTAMFIVAAVVLILFGYQEFIIQTPMGFMRHFVGSGAVLFNQSITATLIRIDWLSTGAYPRLNVFSPYPTASGGLIGVILVIVSCRLAMGPRRNRWEWGIAGILFVGLLMTLSRMSILSFFLALIILWCFQKRHAGIRVLFFLLISIALVPAVEECFRWVLNLRGNSNETRLAGYLWSLEQFHGADWILGFGLKPREDFFFMPLGSHSTYLSLLFKSGIVGVVTFLAWQVYLIVSWLKMKKRVIHRRDLFLLWNSLGGVFLFMLGWMLTDDLDAPQLLSFLYFLLIGIFERLKSYVLAEESAQGNRSE